MLYVENRSIWEFVDDGAIGIPTNGYITRNGSGVMGAGLALEAKEKYPGIAYDLGTLTRREGHIVGWLRDHPHQILSIPVKPSFIEIKCEKDVDNILPRVKHLYKIGSCVPGYHCIADKELIKTSIKQLIEFIEREQLTKVFIPALGCGNGGLSFQKDLLSVLKSKNIPDNIVLVLNGK